MRITNDVSYGCGTAIRAFERFTGYVRAFNEKINRNN